MVTDKFKKLKREGIMQVLTSELTFQELGRSPWVMEKGVGRGCTPGQMEKSQGCSIWNS